MRKTKSINRVTVKMGRAKDWEIEVSTAKTGKVVFAIYISTLIAVILGMISLFSSLFQLIKMW